MVILILLCLILEIKNEHLCLVLEEHDADRTVALCSQQEFLHDYSPVFYFPDTLWEK